MRQAWAVAAPAARQADTGAPLSSTKLTGRCMSTTAGAGSLPQGSNCGGGRHLTAVVHHGDRQVQVLVKGGHHALGLLVAAGRAQGRRRQCALPVRTRHTRSSKRHSPGCRCHTAAAAGIAVAAWNPPQQSVVHKDAVQPVAQHTVHQGGSHRAVHAAAERADDVVLGAHLFRGREEGRGPSGTAVPLLLFPRCLSTVAAAQALHSSRSMCEQP